jgi:soluble cytochrome b562
MEERNQGIRAAQKQINTQSNQIVENDSETKTVDELKLMAELMEDMQRNLEPLRDKALDEKARLTGYSQCAEAMIKIIADRAVSYQRRAIDLTRQQKEEAKPKRRGRAKKTTQ